MNNPLNSWLIGKLSKAEKPNKNNQMENMLIINASLVIKPLMPDKSQFALLFLIPI